MWFGRFARRCWRVEPPETSLLQFSKAAKLRCGLLYAAREFEFYVSGFYVYEFHVTEL